MSWSSGPVADCLACARPQPDTAYVCAACSAKLGQALHTAAALVPELETAVARLARFGEPGPRSRGRAPAAPIRPDGGTMRHYADQADGWPSGLPVNLAAAQVREDVANTVSGWCRVVLEQRGPQPGDMVGLAPAMRWLAGHLEWIRHQRFADECFDELGDAARQVEHAVDRPAERVDAGVCLAVLPESGEKCQRRLSAPAGAAKVRCPGCGATHDAQARRRLLLGQARDVRGSAAEVARWLSVLDIPTTESMVRGLGHRGRVLPDGAGRYRLGDVEQCRLEQIERGRKKVAA